MLLASLYFGPMLVIALVAFLINRHGVDDDITVGDAIKLLLLALCPGINALVAFAAVSVYLDDIGLFDRVIVKAKRK